MSDTSVKSAANQFGEGTVEIVRVFDAPCALVWQAWTDPKMLAQWFGPRGFSSSVPELDVRVGGSLRIVMHGPGGGDYPMKGIFREVIAPERLVFSNIAIDNEGKHLLEGLTTVTFAETNGKTLRILRDLYPSSEALDEAVASGSVSGVVRLFDAVTGQDRKSVV